MKRPPAFLICLLSISIAGCATHSSSRTKEVRRADENAARIKALTWVALLDVGDYGQAYSEQAARLRLSGTEAQFIRSMKGRRAPFGRMLKRTFVGAAFTQKLVGAPDGNYETILFKTFFEHKTVAAERVILTRESGCWKVIDYRGY
jgi:hypothetical protein